MTDEERTDIAEKLIAFVFSLRPDNGEPGQAWVLGVASTALARAILGSTGPHGDPDGLLELSAQQVKDIVTTAQANRDLLTTVPH